MKNYIKYFIFLIISCGAFATHADIVLDLLSFERALNSFLPSPSFSSESLHDITALPVWNEQILKKILTNFDESFMPRFDEYGNKIVSSDATMRGLKQTLAEQYVAIPTVIQTIILQIYRLLFDEESKEAPDFAWCFCHPPSLRVEYTLRILRDILKQLPNRSQKLIYTAMTSEKLLHEYLLCSLLIDSFGYKSIELHCIDLIYEDLQFSPMHALTITNLSPDILQKVTPILGSSSLTHQEKNAQIASLIRQHPDFKAALRHEMENRPLSLFKILEKQFHGSLTVHYFRHANSYISWAKHNEIAISILHMIDSGTPIEAHITDESQEPTTPAIEPLLPFEPSEMPSPQEFSSISYHTETYNINDETAYEESYPALQNIVFVSAPHTIRTKKPLDFTNIIIRHASPSIPATLYSKSTRAKACKQVCNTLKNSINTAITKPMPWSRIIETIDSINEKLEKGKSPQIVSFAMHNDPYIAFDDIALLLTSNAVAYQSASYSYINPDTNKEEDTIDIYRFNIATEEPHILSGRPTKLLEDILHRYGFIYISSQK